MADDRRMPFMEHLKELRKRILWMLVFLFAGFIICWEWHKEGFDWLMEPYEQAVLAMPDALHQTLLSMVPGSGVAAEPRHVPILRYKGLIEPIMVYLKTALLMGVFVALPFIFWQVWMFISPGLYPKERRMAWPFIIGTTLFFAFGSWFCRYVALEPMYRVFLAFGAENTESFIMMQEYFGLTSRFILVFGVVFELPVIISFLALLGFVTPKGLLRLWKWALVLSFIIGGVLTPPDPFSQIILAVPLFVLYMLSIGFAFVFARMRKTRLDEAVASATS